MLNDHSCYFVNSPRNTEYSDSIMVYLWQSLWYTSPACAVCLLCSLCVYELDDLLAAGGLAIIDENKLTFLLASSLVKLYINLRLSYLVSIHGVPRLFS